MAEVLFYHLERARVEAVLPDLLEKTLQRGWRALVRAGDEDSVQFLDEKLWTYRDESFLPHGVEGAEDKTAAHPIMLTAKSSTDGISSSNAEILFAVEGAFLDPAEIQNFTRCVLIFNGADEEALTTARGLWKDLRDTEHQATYWRQSESGRWEKQG